MSVAAQIQKQVDNIAAYRKSILAAVAGRTHLWQMAYNADDETYDNRVLGSSLSNVDTIMDTAPYGSQLAFWFAAHNDYITKDLSLSGGLDAYVTSLGWRVPWHFAQTSVEAGRPKLTTTNVFPREDVSLGTHVKSGDVFTAGTAVDTTVTGLGRIEAVVPGGTTIGGANYTVTATLTRQDATTVSLGVTINSSSPPGTAKIFGEQALTGNADSGQKVVLIATTTQFKVGEPVLVYDSNGTEWGVVASIQASTSITLTNNLINNYTTAASAKVAPMFSAVTAATCSGTGTTGDQVGFWVAPDRVVSLTGSP